MKNILTKIKEKKYRLTGAKIQQTESRELKQDFTNALENLLKTYENEDFKIARTLKGLGIEIANTELGCVNLEIEIKVKDIDYDLETENADYLADIEAKKTKKLEKEKAKAEKIKVDTEKRRLKEELKKLKESEGK